MQNFNRTTSGVTRPSFAAKLGGATGRFLAESLFMAITVCIIAAILMALWPHACYLFPRAVGEGWLEPQMSFLQAVVVVTLVEGLIARVKR